MHIGDDDLLVSVAVELRVGTMRAGKVVEPGLVVGVHKNRIDADPGIGNPPNRRQTYRERLGLPGKMQVQLEQVTGNQPL